MRTFVAVDLPDRLGESVAAVQDRLRPAAGLTVTDPGNAHVTLKFLGEVDPDRLGRVEDAVGTAVAEAGVDPFQAAVGGLGVFPDLDYVRVVWAGFRAGRGDLTRLHESIERETTALGFDPESHEFTPHVTLARMNDARGKERVTRAVREDDPDVGTFPVEEVRLKESRLGEDGPHYSTVARFPL